MRGVLYLNIVMAGDDRTVFTIQCFCGSSKGRIR